VVLLAAGWRVKRSRRSGPVRGDLRLDLKLDFKEAVFGGEKEIRISHLETCEVCSGSGAKPGTLRPGHALRVVDRVKSATPNAFGSFTQYRLPVWYRTDD